MSDRPWKQHERHVAELIGGGRYWANSGEVIDCGPDKTHPDCRFVAQAKEVSRMSLEELTQLAESIAAHGAKHAKFGVVAVKVRRGRGVTSPTLIVMTESVFRSLTGENGAANA